jgi:8-oxo-dGTP diphosphatase
MPYTYEYPRPALTVDCVVFGYDNIDEALRVLLIERNSEPFKNQWALPGGFVEMDEDLKTAAKRELEEETGLSDIFLEQLFTFGMPNRDPRGRVVSVAYYALINLRSTPPTKPATDANQAEWFDVNNIPSLAFDHPLILETALTRLRNKLRYEPIGFELLPKKFPLSALQKLYELILAPELIKAGKTGLDKRNFRKKLQRLGILKELGERQQHVAHRAAQLYSFDEQKYEQLIKSGFNFEL